MKLRAVLLSLILFMIIPYFTGICDEPLTLEFRLAPGSSYLCRMDMSRNISQTIDDKIQSFRQSLLMVWRYDVTGKDKKGNLKIDLTYTRIKITQEMGFQSSEYDSDNPPSYIEPSMRGYAVLKGAKLTTTIDSRGDVVELDGAQALLDKVISSLDLPDSPRKDQIISEIRKQFGEDALKSSIQQITSFYPPGPIVVGANWESETSESAGFPMNIKNRYTLVSREKGIAKIDVKSEITASPDSGGMNLGEINIFYDIAGSQSGVITVDEATGLPISSEMDMSFEGNVRASGVPDEPARVWPIKADGRAVVTFERN